jgi:CelD/BcsL family acetyltransferase involved in cellulose biosynthesis
VERRLVTTATVTTRLLRGFDDPSFDASAWQALLATGRSDVVFLTWQWQSAWWESFARGDLMLIAAERDGEVVALAPLFSQAGMIYFVGSGGSDYLDFIGDISDPEIIDALLTEARRHVHDFIGFVFYHVLDNSVTGARLQEAATRLGLKIFDEGDMPAPLLDLTDSSAAQAAPKKKSLIRHEKFFAHDGSLSVTHAVDGNEILGNLDEFFAQHIERWNDTATPSLFAAESQRRFYGNLTRAASREGWLRFTRLDWEGRPIAFHFGFCYRGRYLWYKPSFAVDLARHSPGEVLLRQLLLAAIAEGAHTFDFGLGDEVFKSRFATRVDHVRNWGLYDPRSLTPGQ